MPRKRLISLHPASRDDIGDLVTRRPLPGPGLDQLDPFLFLNHHGPQVYLPHNQGLPFGPHPHRGFETVTFILAGELMHQDSAGHESIIRAGGVQWMTAGSGLVHAEVSSPEFKAAGGPLEILQLWVNLPARLKMTVPRYVGLQRDQIPSVPTTGHGQLHVIAGEWHGTRGAVQSLTDVFMATAELPIGARVGLQDLGGRNVFLYVVRGAVLVGEQAVPAHTLAELDRTGDTLEITATAATALLLGHAAPLDEPVVAHGPFVMNTREEIVAAMRDYQAGKFSAG